MKIALITLVVLTAAVVITACTSSTTNNSVTTTTPDFSAKLNAQVAANYTLVENFTRVSEANEAPLYSGSFQEANGTLHSVIIYTANGTSEAQTLFKEQKAGYIDASLNATVNANTSTHWAITTNDTSVSGWVVQPNTAGPFGLSLDTAYVLISQDMNMSITTSETVTPNESTAVLTTGVG